MGKTGKKGGKRLKKKELAKMLMELFQNNPAEVYDIKRIFRDLKLDTHPAKLLCMDLLEDLAMDDYIKETEKLHFRLNTTGQVFEAIFNRKANGKNTVTPLDGGEPVLVAERNSLHAMGGDKVKVTLLARRKHHVREAQVVEILERRDRSFVGRLEVRKDFAFLLTEDRTLANDIFIPKKALKGGKSGDKAVVKITEWPEHAKNPIGKVVDILGQSGDNTTEMHAILAEYGLPYAYPKSVEDEAEKIDPGITAEEIGRREDLREVTTFTIDPRDAKDFDDAISIRKTDDGLWEVGVHIADVSHYVKEGSIIDKEAVKRATSVYLVDRVIPMLPHALSNGICSLNAGENRLALSCIMTVDAKGNVIDHVIAETVIKVDRRMSYTSVKKILEDHDEVEIREYEELVPMFERMRDLAAILRKKRMKRGSIDFDFPETKIILDEQGKPVDIKPYDRNVATKIIEDFMLIANETVAQDYFWQELPFVYRTHDNPDTEKIKKLGTFINNFGYTIHIGQDEIHPKELQKLLMKIDGTPEEALISRLTLRSMKQAKYTTVSTGHFGLATNYYCHFTSPIRRYPDLQIHRIIKDNLRGRMNQKRIEHYDSILPEVAVQCSSMERRADEAERETDKLKKCEYMEERIGQVFEGVISGVQEWGFYVELPNTVEGLVHVTSLTDDFYHYEESSYEMIGERTNKHYKLGQKVKVIVADTDKIMRTIDFRVVRDDVEPDEAVKDEASVLSKMTD